MGGPSLANAVLGAWLAFAPWMFSFSSKTASSNSLAIGLLVILFALLSAAAPRYHVFAWLNALAGAGALVSPWVLGYANEPDAMWNSVLVGGLIVLFALARALTLVPTGYTDQSEPGDQPWMR